MNRFEGSIAKIDSHGHLSMVTVSVSGGLSVRSIVIETPETARYLKTGQEIAVLFKETEVILCTVETPAISIQNRFEVMVREIEEGSLLSRILLQGEVGELAAVIPSETLSLLGLQTGKKVMALIKTNEVMLSEI